MRPSRTSSPTRVLAAALVMAAAAAAWPACGDGGSLPVDDPDATAGRLRELRLRSWDLPGTFSLVSEGTTGNDELVDRSADPNRRRDQFDRWGRVVAFSQEFRSDDGTVAVRFQTVVYETEDGAGQAFTSTPTVFEDVPGTMTRSPAVPGTGLGDETAAYRLVYGDPEGDHAEGHYLTWRRGRVVLSTQTIVLEGAADQGQAEELAAALDRRFTEGNVR